MSGETLKYQNEDPAIRPQPSPHCPENSKTSWIMFKPLDAFTTVLPFQKAHRLDSHFLGLESACSAAVRR